MPAVYNPGGPPSNLAAFLLLALPGLMKLAGHRSPGLPRVPAVLASAVAGQKGWTQVVFGEARTLSKAVEFLPLDRGGRLAIRETAEAAALLLVPEEADGVAAGEMAFIHCWFRRSNPAWTSWFPFPAPIINRFAQSTRNDASR